MLQGGRCGSGTASVKFAGLWLEENSLIDGIVQKSNIK